MPKISELPAQAPPLDGTELVLLVKGGVTRRMVLNDLRFPLGSSNNPVRDANAQRPIGIPVVHWLVSANPANAGPDDIIDLEAGATPNPVVTVYEELFTAASTAGFVQNINAGSIAHDATFDGGSLRWSAPAAGFVSSVHQFPGNLRPVTGSKTYTATILAQNSAPAARGMRVAVDEFDSAGNIVGGGKFADPTSIASTAATPAGTEVALQFVTEPSTVNVRLILQAIQVNAGDVFRVGRLRLTG